MVSSKVVEQHWLATEVREHMRANQRNAVGCSKAESG